MKPQLKAQFLEPMLALGVSELPTGLDWSYELKLDDYRALGLKSEGSVRLFSRNGKDFSRRFPRCRWHLHRGPLIERVALTPDSMQITLSIRALLPVDRFTAGGSNLRVSRLVPLQMRRRGVETRLVFPSEIQASHTDPALLRALPARPSVVLRTGGGNRRLD